ARRSISRVTVTRCSSTRTRRSQRSSRPPSSIPDSRARRPFSGRCSPAKRSTRRRGRESTREPAADRLPRQHGATPCSGIGDGSVLRDQKKSEEAIATFRKVIESDPTRPEPYIDLAGLHADLGQLDKAESILADAKAAGADDPSALLHVGITYFNKKDWAHAESRCRRVIDNGTVQDGDRASAYAILGRVQLNNGKTDEAVASLQKSLEIDPSGRFAAQTKEILKALKSSTPSSKRK